MGDTILHKGQVDLRKREQEIQMLKITLADQARHKEVMLKKRDTVPGFEGEVKALQQELKTEREECDRLSKALVTPNNTQRWRWVRQEPPDPDELRDKIHLLEERLNDKQEQLLEKAQIPSERRAVRHAGSCQEGERLPIWDSCQDAEDDGVC